MVEHRFPKHQKLYFPHFTFKRQACDEKDWWSLSFHLFAGSWEWHTLSIYRYIHCNENPIHMHKEFVSTIICNLIQNYWFLIAPCFIYTFGNSLFVKVTAIALKHFSTLLFTIYKLNKTLKWLLHNCNYNDMLHLEYLHTNFFSFFRVFSLIRINSACHINFPQFQWIGGVPRFQMSIFIFASTIFDTLVKKDGYQKEATVSLKNDHHRPLISIGLRIMFSLFSYIAEYRRRLDPRFVGQPPIVAMNG